MRKVAYDEKPKGTGNSGTHIAADEFMNENYDRQHMEEGFAASNGVRPQTAETGGRIRRSATGDDSIPSRTPDLVREENPGLADN